MDVEHDPWRSRALVRDLGDVDQSEKPVKEVVGDRIWTTVALTGFTVIFTWTFAIPIGIYSAVRQHSVGDYVFTFLGFSGLAVPDFLLGLVLMYLAFAYLNMSVGGLFSADFQEAPWDVDRMWDLLQTSVDSGHRLGHLRDGWPHPSHAQQPA